MPYTNTYEQTRIGCSLEQMCHLPELFQHIRITQGSRELSVDNIAHL